MSKHTLHVMEAVTNTASGLVISFIVYMFMSYVLGIENTYTDGIVMVSVFTVISVLRNYGIRLIFDFINKRQKKT